MRNAFQVLAFILILSGCSKEHRFLPDSIGRLKLSSSFTGGRAEEMINKLHPSDVASEASEIGIYEADTLSAILYVSKFENSDVAMERFKSMLLKIAHGGTPFGHLNQVEVEGRLIFMVLGLGQVHYFYSEGDKVVWFSVDFPLAVESIRELLRDK
jgi:hypothetical protein